jgi:hypothetical protein
MAEGIPVDPMTLQEMAQRAQAKGVVVPPEFH